MNSNKYTLDRYEESFGVFLWKEDESIQKLVPKEHFKGLREGDIIELKYDEHGDFHSYKKLDIETESRKQEVGNLVEKLKTRNKI